MDDVRGDFLGPPHGTTPFAQKQLLISLKILADVSLLSVHIKNS